MRHFNVFSVIWKAENIAELTMRLFFQLLEHCVSFPYTMVGHIASKIDFFWFLFCLRGNKFLITIFWERAQDRKRKKTKMQNGLEWKLSAFHPLLRISIVKLFWLNKHKNVVSWRAKNKRSWFLCHPFSGHRSSKIFSTEQDSPTDVSTHGHFGPLLKASDKAKFEV